MRGLHVPDVFWTKGLAPSDVVVDNVVEEDPVHARTVLAPTRAWKGRRFTSSPWARCSRPGLQRSSRYSGTSGHDHRAHDAVALHSCQLMDNICFVYADVIRSQPRQIRRVGPETSPCDTRLKSTRWEL